MRTIQEKQQLDQLLLRLTYSLGIGVIGKGKILAHILTHPVPLSAYELAEIAHLTTTKARFVESFQNQTKTKIAQNLHGQTYITYFDEQYPEQLRQIASPPIVLFYKGNIDWLQQPKMMAIVGARQATAYATRVLYTFVPPLIQEEITVVSGLAKGVDHNAHQQAIQAKGKTIGVVACGLDRCYPKEVLPIFKKMCHEQLVISEYPAGVGVQKHHFPLRNRIIAGLADALCVIEAKQRSGALITAQLAMEYGREVFAVPGEILSGQSQGCHELIRDGAFCVTHPNDILENMLFYRVNN